MHSSSVLALALSAVGVAAQGGYQLETVFDASNFFSEFKFFDQHDPTNGFVDYVDIHTASDNSLAGYQNGSVYMGVDTVTKNPSNGRRSVRVSSNKSWTHGLFISDIAHMPGSICGTWPAMWWVGDNWPAGGEIDIIEGVNAQTTNLITMHTSEGCTLVDKDCNAGDGHNGCGVGTSDNQNYGDGFNDVGGGVYAVEWTSKAITVWFFQRSAIPADISNGNPDPSSWGQPTANFEGGSGCNLDDHFVQNSMIFDTTFCGDWAGKVFSGDGECSSLGSSCEDYVANNPEAFVEAYWLINSIKVYQQS
ncbi:glycoside hydrolase family 16 protein [Mariannaea sp. PMI_226]|nr:glycoside hydrolase family 16 protein [Mariannaea sp. PMI_226]